MTRYVAYGHNVFVYAYTIYTADGVDYSLNGGERSAVIQANETHINIPVNIIDDDKIEVGERFEIEITANFIGIGDYPSFSPLKERILILDNDG